MNHKNNVDEIHLHDMSICADDRNSDYTETNASTPIHSSFSSPDSQRAIIDSGTGCVHYDLTGGVGTVFSYLLPIPPPHHTCGWSSLTHTCEGELRRILTDL